MTVDFFTNCWERDYRQVLSPGFVRRKAADFLFPFRSVVVTVNNVNDLKDARRRAGEAVGGGDADRVVFVADGLPAALRTCGLTRRGLGRVRHFLDFLLVTVTCTDADYLVHCAADIALDRPFDWVTPALERLGREPTYLVANPDWAAGTAGALGEAERKDGPYLVGHGFSDTVFLVKRTVLAGPVYSHTHESGSNYPLSRLGAVFEQRVDAFMRNEGYWRITDPRVRYQHFGQLGSAYPKPPAWRRAAGWVKRRLVRGTT